MRLARRRSTFAAAIPTATMADIAFLLIIFFMVTTAFTLDHTPMELPETVAQEQAAQGAALVAIAPDGSLRFTAGEEESEPVASLVELAGRIRTLTAVNSLHPFLLKADRNLRYEAVDRVLTELREARAENVTLLSRSEGGR